MRLLQSESREENMYFDWILQPDGVGSVRVQDRAIHFSNLWDKANFHVRAHGIEIMSRGKFCHSAQKAEGILKS